MCTVLFDQRYCNDDNLHIIRSRRPCHGSSVSTRAVLNCCFYEPGRFSCARVHQAVHRIFARPGARRHQQGSSCGLTIQMCRTPPLCGRPDASRPRLSPGHQSWSTREPADSYPVRRFKSRPALRLAGGARTAEQLNLVSGTRMDIGSEGELTNGDSSVAALVPAVQPYLKSHVH